MHDTSFLEYSIAARGCQDSFHRQEGDVLKAFFRKFPPCKTRKFLRKTAAGGFYPTSICSIIKEGAQEKRA